MSWSAEDSTATPGAEMHETRQTSWSLKRVNVLVVLILVTYLWDYSFTAIAVVRIARVLAHSPLDVGRCRPAQGCQRS
jgi:hypothetical protein